MTTTNQNMRLQLAPLPPDCHLAVWVSSAACHRSDDLEALELRAPKLAMLNLRGCYALELVKIMPDPPGTTPTPLTVRCTLETHTVYTCHTHIHTGWVSLQVQPSTLQSFNAMVPCTVSCVIIGSDGPCLMCWVCVVFMCPTRCPTACRST